jgi:hypothetical protein
MEKMQTRKADCALHLDLDQLIAAAGEVAFEYSDNDREAYDMTRTALIEIIKKSVQVSDSESNFESAASPSRHLH